MTETGQRYFFSQAAEAERSRLDGLSAQFDPVTIRQLRAVGVAPGWRCLEVGAGAGSIAGWLADAVGPAGRVVATDLDVRFLDRLGDRVEVRRHDVTGDPLEPDAFDLVHVRAVLEHLPGVAPDVVARLASTLRPGGVLVVEDFLCGGASARTVEPAIRPVAGAPTMTKVFDAVAAGLRAAGADPEYALQLPSVLIAAGFTDVGAELTARWVTGGAPESRFYAGTLRERGDLLVAHGLLDAADVALALATLDDPAARWFGLDMVTAWGRRPGQSGQPSAALRAGST